MTVIDDPTAVPTDGHPIEIDPVDRLAALIRGAVRPEDIPALERAVRNLPELGRDDAPLTLRDVVHSSLTANAEFDGATQSDLGWMKAPRMNRSYPDAPVIALPEPEPLSADLGDVIDERRSDHNFGPDPLDLDVVSCLLHHAAGLRGTQPAYNVPDFPMRIVPSAGGLQPHDIFIAAHHIADLEKGMYYYDPLEHALVQVERGNLRGKSTQTTIFNEWLFHAPAVLYLALDFERVAWKYGTRGYRFAHVDLGVLTESLYLVATALDLVTCPVAAFDDRAVNELLRLDGREQAASLLFALGRPPMMSDR